jgi:hypothetical protein
VVAAGETELDDMDSYGNRSRKPSAASFYKSGKAVNQSSYTGMSFCLLAQNATKCFTKTRVPEYYA